MNTETDKNTPVDGTPIKVRLWSRVLAGIILIKVGIAYALRASGVPLPEWLFTWKMLLVVLGIYLGAKHTFQKGPWIFLLLIGLAFLADDVLVFPGIQLSSYVLPALIIAAGLFVMFNPGRKHMRRFAQFNPHCTYEEVHKDDYLDSVSIMGGVKKNIFTKTFKGGEVVTIMGGAEINLLQADMETAAVIEVVQIFGGTKIIVPSHWEVQSEMVAILGGIEDKRPLTHEMQEHAKKLIIRGTSIFGGIEIKSY